MEVCIRRMYQAWHILALRTEFDPEAGRKQDLQRSVLCNAAAAAAVQASCGGTWSFQLRGGMDEDGKAAVAGSGSGGRRTRAAQGDELSLAPLPLSSLAHGRPLLSAVRLCSEHGQPAAQGRVWIPARCLGRRALPHGRYRLLQRLWFAEKVVRPTC